MIWKRKFEQCKDEISSSCSSFLNSVCRQCSINSIIGFCHYWLVCADHVYTIVWHKLTFFFSVFVFFNIVFSLICFFHKHINCVAKLTLEIYLIRLLNGFTHNFIWAVCDFKMHRQISLSILLYSYSLVPRRISNRTPSSSKPTPLNRFASTHAYRGEPF